MFKQCTKCHLIWKDRNAFLSDPDIGMIGYQVNFEDLQLGFFLFNHLSCQTTLAISAARFIDLYDGPIYAQAKTGTEECEAHCLHKNDLEPCGVPCECAYVREIIQILKKWPAGHHQAAPADRAVGA
jgi:hypothetical protein